jgi:hypothetical protein
MGRRGTGFIWLRLWKSEGFCEYGDEFLGSVLYGERFKKVWFPWI